jgi:signal transduction histidine kinase/CheY-like chemotaxis protein
MCPTAVDESVFDMALEIKESCEIAIGILNDLLLYEKLEGGILVLDKHCEPAAALIYEAVKTFNIQARQANVRLDFTLDGNMFDSKEVDEPEFFIDVDKPKISQVLRNLVSNAIKFSTPANHDPENATAAVKGVEVRVSIVYYCGDEDEGENTQQSSGSAMLLDRDEKAQTMLPEKCSAAAADDALLQQCYKFKTNEDAVPAPAPIGGPNYPYLRVEVIDVGPGISPENQELLFNQIIQFDPHRLQGGNGSGLGLFISKGIMDLHGGFIGVYSEGEGKGCTFHIDVPVHKIRGSCSVDLTQGESYDSDSLGKATATEHTRIALEPSWDDGPTLAVTPQASANVGYKEDRDVMLLPTSAFLDEWRAKVPSRIMEESHKPSSLRGGAVKVHQCLPRTDGTALPLQYSSEGFQSVPGFATPAPAQALDVDAEDSSSALENSEQSIRRNLIYVPLNSASPSSPSSLSSPSWPSSSPRAILSRSYSSCKSTLTTDAPTKQDMSLTTGEGKGDRSVSAMTVLLPEVPVLLKGSSVGNLSYEHDQKHDQKHDRVTATEPAQEKQNLQTKKKRFKVLVVDDSVSNRKMMVRFLRMAKLCDDPTEAEDGAEALQIIEDSLQRQCQLQLNRHPDDNPVETIATNTTPTPIPVAPYDVILMDFVMPIMDGPTATKAIREAGFKGLVIGVTGNVLPEDRAYFINQGATAVMNKPLDVNQLRMLLIDG